MMSSPQIIRVFEHQTIRVGELVEGLCFSRPHFLALVEYAASKREKYFIIGFDSVRFLQYVGVIQIAHLTIEILPKADRYGQAEDPRWQKFLLELLKTAHWLRPVHSSPALLRLEHGSILDYLIDQYLQEVEWILKRGAALSYSRKEGNLRVLKGRLLFHKHLRQNSVHQEMFYTDHQVFDADHLLNRVLYKALKNLNHFPLNGDLSARLHRLLVLFPKCTEIEGVEESLFTRLGKLRENAPYRAALELARMLLLNYRPGIRGGKYPLMGILFNMNELWEGYIYNQLFELKNQGVQVYRQSRANFWGKQYLQSDILLTYGSSRVVLDTKWKTLSHAQPTVEDLRQMFVYSQFFNANRTVLVYPRLGEEQDLGPITFDLDSTKPKISCQLCFIHPLKNNRLNSRLGEELFKQITQE